MFLTPGLFGFLFGSAAGTLASRALGDHVELPMRLLVMGSYGALYVVFVAAHLKRPDPYDRVLRPTLTKVVIGYNAVLAVLVFVAILLNFVLNGAWFLIAVYARWSHGRTLRCCLAVLCVHDACPRRAFAGSQRALGGTRGHTMPPPCAACQAFPSCARSLAATSRARC